MEITLGSLFDGAGGFPLAGTMAGITPKWASEIEPFPIRVTTKRFPDMKHIGNITEVDGGEIDPVDIITFGSPCQDLSVAGSRKGLAGERSGLFLEAVRVIREMREKTNGQKPEFIVWENVPGAFSSNGGEDFRTVLEEIAKIKDPGVCIPGPDSGKWTNAGEIVGDGYSIAYRVYDSQFWGLAQRRKRIYLVADFSAGRAGKIQFECDRLFRDTPQGAGAGEETSEAAGGYLEESGRIIYLNNQGGSRMDVAAGISAAPRSEMHGHPPVMAAFSGKQGGKAGGIGYSETKAPTLKAEAGGNMVPHVMALHLTQDPIVYEDMSPCISTGNPRSGQAAVGVLEPKPTAYGLSSKASNAWKSNNPNSGCYEAETARTLDSRGGDATCNQGGMLIISPAAVFETPRQDPVYAIGRDNVTVWEEKAQTLTRSDMPGTVAQPYTVGNGQVHDLTLDEKAWTLNCMHDAQAVILPQAVDASHADDVVRISDTVNCIQARDYKGGNCVLAEMPEEKYPYIVRRLMPLECSRLQGYPDYWADGLETEEPSEKEIDWWMEVFESHRIAVKPDTKPKTRNQIRKWLQHPHSDSAEYKMWGNSLAIPNAYHVLKGIAEELQTGQEQRTMYIASWSGGKDSTASIILAHEHGEPLDLIIFSEVMFDKEISGELPEHIDFVKNKAIPLFGKWGYKVKILHSEKNYIDIFMREPTRGKYFGTGLRAGFPMAGKCTVNREAKIKPINDFLKQICQYKITQYIGIAIDEPKRLERLDGVKTSLLEKYGYTEQMAYDLCVKYELLSPVYNFTKRGGCWFCQNARKKELRHLRDCHPELWQRLMDLEDEPNLIGHIWNTLEKKSIHMIERQYKQEDAQMTIWDFIKE